MECQHNSYYALLEVIARGHALCDPRQWYHVIWPYLLLCALHCDYYPTETHIMFRKASRIYTSHALGTPI